MLISSTVGDVSRETSPTVLDIMLTYYRRSITTKLVDKSRCITACLHAAGEDQRDVADHPNLQTR